MAEGTNITGGTAAPTVRQAAVAKAASQGQYPFGPRPGALGTGIQGKGYRSPNQKARAERREARIDREQARPRPPFRETGVGAAFSPKNAPPGTPHVNIGY